MKRKKTPKLPKGFKMIAKYVSNDYLNVVCETRATVTFFLWDGYSETYNHVLNFPKFN